MTVLRQEFCFFWERIIPGLSDICHPTVADPLVLLGALLLLATLILHRNSEFTIRKRHKYVLGGISIILLTPLLLPIPMKTGGSPDPAPIKAVDIQCHANVDAAGNDEIRITLKNGGNQPVDATNVNVFVTDAQQYMNVTRVGLNWSDKAFTEPGRNDTVTVFVNRSEASDFLVPDKFYAVEVEFSSIGQDVPAGSCVAKER